MTEYDIFPKDTLLLYQRFVLFLFFVFVLFCFYHNDGRYYTKLWRRLKMPLIRLLLSNSFIRIT